MEICTKNITYEIVLKLSSRLSFLPPFTSGKKCLEFPLHEVIIFMFNMCVSILLPLLMNLVNYGRINGIFLSTTFL